MIEPIVHTFTPSEVPTPPEPHDDWCWIACPHTPSLSELHPAIGVTIEERPIIVTNEREQKRAMLSTLEERDRKGNLRWLRGDGTR